MRGNLQSDINPYTASGSREFNTSKAPAAAAAAAAPAKPNEVDFLTVLNNANADTKKARQAKELGGGGISGSETYKEFLDKLDDKNRQQRVPKNNLDKDDFLKLFVTQLQNQDPLNPEESTEMASRLAQFNSLEQMLNVNKTLTAMSDTQKQSRSVDLVNYIGKEVELKGGRFKLESEGETTIGFKLAKPATNTVLEIRDGSGLVVDSTALGNVNEGDQKISWDGRKTDGTKAPAGIYSFSVTAQGLNGEEVPVTIVSRATITGVDLKDKDGLMHSSLGKIKFDEVESIGVEDFQKKTAEAVQGIEQATDLNPQTAAPTDVAPIIDALPKSMQVEAPKKTASKKPNIDDIIAENMKAAGAATTKAQQQTAHAPDQNIPSSEPIQNIEAKTDS